MNNQQAVSLSFGQTNENFCSATIYRSSVAKGYKIQSKQNNNKSISADCHWDGKYYVQSSKHQTSVDLEISDLDRNAKNAVLNISLKLIEPKSGEFFTLNNVALNLSGNNFDSLVKEI
ncbi:hypothetical protein NX722_03240 [Endozoicomonas gorgoniicola]|uniref:Uncharacterized protein n=1 Tax=Endozoicomonas gorgoniicola TaxID=1234144 RepID=A0ABT3MQM3_9GAMM|nr:hypothetical protein [Endozoicomonas gorgoniicola]MCW7551673.1 hypothetical protein [Endozoicomonas gorgoniicola]